MTWGEASWNKVKRPITFEPRSVLADVCTADLGKHTARPQRPNRSVSESSIAGMFEHGHSMHDDNGVPAHNVNAPSTTVTSGSGIDGFSSRTLPPTKMNRTGRGPRRAKQKALREINEYAESRQPGGVFFSNLTEWGPQSKRYFNGVLASKEEAQWEAIGIAEHHLKWSDRGRMTKVFDKLGYNR